MGRGNMVELWSFNTILRIIEMASRLKANFFKIKLYGIDVESDFLTEASSFLACKIENFYFNFLRILE